VSADRQNQSIFSCWNVSKW